jgi:hypothetical protein
MIVILRGQVGVLHVHIGPGKLGLGLVVAGATEAGLDSHLIASKDSSWVRDEYRIALTGERSTRLRVIDTSRAVSVADLADSTRQRIAENHGEAMLITTAVGAAMEDCVDLIVELAELHAGSGARERVFIACENNLGQCYQGLVDRLQEHGVDCRSTMVNRICPERQPAHDDAAIVVRADPYAEWMIEGEIGGEALGRLGDLPFVTFVPDVEPFQLRKLWMVNGGHLALGLMGRLRRRTSVRTVANEAGPREELRQLQVAVAKALPPEWAVALGDSEAYGLAQIDPICRTEDSVARILSRLIRADLRPFLEDANRKLGEPARAYRERFGTESPEFREVFRAMHSVLLNLNSYKDSDEVRSGAVNLDRETDREAIVAYGILLNGIVSTDVRDERVERLRGRLSDHYV